ncbi:MAG: hypothetical protein EZS28_017510 [Streblomastix strix]|uniref:Uncharacterized protein n=1 Tax=Streblomastix strix TaxID=222440 RepID=A0A5J4VW66_9EUKA|nr:MAG: hypothetical protein EZS28_017510 [Streblomastix strix]
MNKARKNRSRICLYEISYNGDQQDQAELIKVGYACALIISIGKIGGSQEDNDNEIKDGLKYISDFLRNLRQGRYYDITFHQQPALIKTCVEQIEEEGGNEEVDSQIENKQVLEYGDQYLKYYANWTIGEILNFFIDKNNPRPNWYFYEF